MSDTSVLLSMMLFNWEENVFPAAATIEDGMLTVTAVNPSYDLSRIVTVTGLGDLKADCLYTSDRVAPYTVFERRDAEPVRTEAGWKIEMSPHSMLCLTGSHDI